MISKKVMLITTLGCEACKIMDEIVKNALSNIELNNQIVYEKHDVWFTDKDFIKKNKITDFPTLLFTICNYKTISVKNKIVGTTNVSEVSEKVKELLSL